MTSLTLSACATSGPAPEAVPLAPLPSDLKVCFNHTVPAPKPGKMTKADVMRLIAALKASEASKTACGRRLIAFYEDQQHG